jgi:hypothetical protein
VWGYDLRISVALCLPSLKSPYGLEPFGPPKLIPEGYLMLRVSPAITIEDSAPKRSPKVVLLALIAAFTMLWAGCNTMPAGSSSSSSSSREVPQLAPHISILTVLPSASVGSSYREVLSVSGGEAPYLFDVSAGKLPPGLALSPQTGSISGVPTQAGTFAFTILVLGGPIGATGVRAYALTVDNCVQCVAVQVSPVNPTVTPGSKVQFAATVSNTGNTAVTWSTSAGSISASGLFTAPANFTGVITVTATSAAQSSAHASSAVAITSSVFAITTTSVPPAVQATPYSEPLQASGGQTPYQWSIASGSLPPGLQLASTGTLSGSATQTGAFTFSVRGTDAASHTAQQSLSLLVSSSQACGPPAYGCSRTDLKIAQLPTPPNVGNLRGANTIVTDPDFGNPVVRITDANTNPEAGYVNRTYVTAGSGSADDNLWNIDSTLFVVEDSGSNGFPFTFNPSTLQAARMYVANFPATNGLMTDSGIWSRVNANILYTYSGTAINKYDFTNRTTPPSSQAVYDFTSSRNCLPAGFTLTWSTKGGVSGDDTVFGMAYSNAGDQGTSVYAVAYKVGSGCSVINTQTGQVGGDWGTKGTINLTDRWTIHNVKLSKDGNWLIIARSRCTSSTCSDAPYFWQVGTTYVTSCGAGGSCSGHWTEGYSHWVNDDNSPMANQVIRAFTQPTSVSYLISNFPPGITAPLDQHQSWNNVDPADSLPFFSSSWSTTTPFPAPWYNEIIGIAADGSGKTWRFAHSFISGTSQRFDTQYGIGNVSQDGKFFIFSSDWMGKLGSESGATTCTIGSNCRGDVFVVQLR